MAILNHTAAFAWATLQNVKILSTLALGLVRVTISNIRIALLISLQVYALLYRLSHLQRLFSSARTLPRPITMESLPYSLFSGPS